MGIFSFNFQVWVYFLLLSWHHKTFPLNFYIYFFVAREFDWYNMFGGIFVLLISLYRAKFCKRAKNTWKESTLS